MAPEERALELVVIGASAGGVEALREVVAALPADLPAAVCVVLHIAPESPSGLAGILRRAGSLPCLTASDGEPLRSGQIVVAPPDHHLVVADGRVWLSDGPRENGHRPSVDVLFRSAAEAGAERVIGVVLSGSRDDGAAGLAVIKAAGGLAVVQDPDTALYAGMPQSALAAVQADVVAPSDRIGAAIAGLLSGRGGLAPAPQGEAPAPPVGEGADPLAGDPSADLGQARAEPLITICPECGGVLGERAEAGVTQWECRVGHRYSTDSLLEAQAKDFEAALWAAARVLEDRRLLLLRLAQRLERNEASTLAEVFRQRAADAAGQASLIRRTLARAASTGIQALTEREPEGIG